MPTLRSKSYIFLLIVLILGVASGVGFTMLKFHKGLDITGGVRLTCQLDFKTLDPAKKQTPKSVLQQMVNIMSVRAHGPLGVTEPIVTAKGDDEIVVELPEDASDQAKLKDLKSIEETIISSAKIYFYWASNVVTDKTPVRPYLEVEQKDPNNLAVNFQPKYGNKVITPSDPEYKRMIDQWTLLASGTDLERADPTNQTGNYIPGLRFSPQAGSKIQQWSRDHFNQGEKLAAVLDGKVISIARVQDGAILGENIVIEGKFPDGYVSTLCDLLNSGSLPVEVKLVGAERVDPTIGAQAMEKMVVAGVIAFAVISLFLIAYYAFPGFVAFLALSLYVLFTLTILKLIGATFSLAGIAGFILSVGMAVDANILVFERFKEEMKAGKSLATAIELGFKRALPAIIDSNACTILTSLVLVNLGTGPVKGFATTLVIGVLISLFTAVMVTRSLLMFFVGSGIASNPKQYALNRDWFAKRIGADGGEKPLQVVNNAKKWFILSAITIVVCIPFFFMNGFRLNVEFRGGYEATYSLTDTTLTADAIQKKLEQGGLTGGNVQMASVDASAAGPAHRVAIIALPPQSGLAGSDAENLTKIADAAGIQRDPTAQFKQIGPALQSETRNNAIIGVIVSSCLIIIYLAIRFGTGFGGFVAGLRFGVSAIGALVHDILVVFGTAAVVGLAFHWEVSALFLTAMLTIIGFSVHDTIVIFDRIRENLRRSSKQEEFGDLINRSITQSFARSINTSATVIVTLLILVLFGTATPELKFFGTSMLIGIVSGTYSSIYNASPILYLWDRAIAARRGPEHSLVGMVSSEMNRTRTIITTAVQPESVSTQTGRSYGQVRRRANAPTKGIDLDD